MKTMLTRVALALLAFSILNAPLSTIFAQGTAFTYQGRLNDSTGPATGTYDLRFTIYDAPTNGTALGGPLTNSATGISNGLFTVALDFGNQFPGPARWLEIAVRTNGVGGFFTLSPRQALTPAPYAITAGNVVSGGLAAGSYGNAVTLSNAANQFSGVFTGNGVNLTNVNAVTLGGLASSNFWKIGGNNVAAGNFLGSTNNQSVEIRANNLRAMQFAYASNAASGYSPNVIGGNSLNSVDPGFVGATIAGGGGFGGGGGNNISADFGTVVGGSGNTVGGQFAVAGGYNSIANGYAATALGSSQATRKFSTALGQGLATGTNSTALGASTAYGYNATAMGQSFAADPYTTAMGKSTAGGTNSTAMGTSSALADNSTAMGYSTASGTNSTAMGYQSQASGFAATAMGYGSKASGAASTALGASTATNDFATALGSSEADGNSSTAAGNSTATGLYSTAMGNSYATGRGSIALGSTSEALADYSFAAGNGAVASYTGSFVWTDVFYYGYGDTAPDQFDIFATGGTQISDGLNVGGSVDIGGPVGIGGSVGIGTFSPETPLHVTSTRGITLGQSSTSGGYTALIIDLSTSSGGYAEMQAIKAAGSTYGNLILQDLGGSLGVGKNNPNPAYKLDVNGTAAATTFVTTSDRNLKENFRAANPRAVLDKVAALPISQWNFKQEPATRHLGPMAQDFYAAFNLGTDDKHIATVDEDGVALAAIQGLNQKLEEENKRKDAEITELNQRLRALEQIILKQKPAPSSHPAMGPDAVEP